MQVFSVLHERLSLTSWSALFPFKNENTFVTGGGLPGRPKPEEQDEQAEQSGSDENLVDMDEDPED